MRVSAADHAEADHGHPVGSGARLDLPDLGGGDRVDNGLGYRIFLVRRYLAMGVIPPYVAWITLLAYVLDHLLLALSKRACWHHLQENPREDRGSGCPKSL